jgi:rubrerythrin
MAASEGLTALEVLGVAIKSEIEAAVLYARLCGQVRNAMLASKLDFLRREEEKHRSILQDVYTHRFSDVELRLPAHSHVPTVDPATLANMTVPELFQLAMRAEQLASNFYAREADRSLDEAGRTTLRYLSHVENGHYKMLETEYELVSRFPDYYNADDFHFGDELMHIGP